MNNKDLTFIAVRFISLYLLVKAFIILSNIISIQLTASKYLQGVVDNPLTNTYLINFIAIVGLAIVLWKYADKISNLAIGNNITTVENGIITAQQLHVIVISTAGLLLFVNAIPELIKVISQMSLTIRKLGLFNPLVIKQAILVIIKTLIELALALVLFCKADRIVVFLYRKNKQLI
ncbi:hypothetical protein IMX26_15735 [Clostridium sp. 'deep sea']|uniref:hypothetical protein n=1 Tax=Clostridium sp. 'deep sea' TaxID=2779445 RepID=UPI0018966730|nr:hypothetical protein [Clostridium sp. 'deep sea']QOR34891.1 hypothetical protein IMX26_15735 [Clostridium sp. 'deep sea']